jgi:hypothetical protein
MPSSVRVDSGHVGFFGLLALVFVVFKLLGKLDWSWYWVLCPIWIPPALILSVLAIVGVGLVVFYGGAFLVNCIFSKKRKGGR